MPQTTAQNLDDVWQAIDEQRASLADLLGDLSEREWETPSLCKGWRVREVAAHLTLSHATVPAVAWAMIRARGSFDRMVRDTARRRARLPVEAYAQILRAMVGSRRKAPGVTPLEPLIDVLVHGQDITIPLHRNRPVPPRAAALAADRVWPNLFPFRAGRRLAGIRFTATDCDWSAGEGVTVEGPMGAILLVLTGRPAGTAQLSGPGLPLLMSRLPAPGPPE
ncbi:maleylpyruvate isomerase family mycothiol-dependent enzyme [Streptacidiphilus sp. EB103A]|uniref:maleylpyruvate isomerase family mycothiol-dependent enzyme n=1 Tax=Streptacidiphilus sp. EB103A TaxID=3156275 RepID=UPI003513F31F